MRRIRCLAGLVLLVGIIVAGFVGQDAYQEYLISRGYVEIRLNTEQTCGQDLDTLLEQMQKDGVAAAFWGEQQNVTVENPEFSREKKVKVQYVRGNAGCLYPNSHVLGLADEQGCLLDEKSAVELFGSLNIVGKQIRCNDRSYRVKGVLEGQENLLVCEDWMESVDCVAVKVESGRNAQDMINRLQNVYGLEGTKMTSLFSFI